MNQASETNQSLIYSNLTKTYNSGQFQSAITIANQLLETRPNQPALLRLKANAEFRLNNFSDAKQSFSKLAEISTLSSNDLFCLAFANLATGNKASAISYLTLLPNNVNAQIQLGQLLSQKGSHAAAALVYENPILANNKSARVSLAFAYLYAGAISNAAAVIDELLKNQDYTPSDLLRDYGRALIAQEKWLEAFNFFSSLLTHSSERVLTTAAATLINIKSLTGDHQGAFIAASTYPRSYSSEMFAAASMAKLREIAVLSGENITRNAHPYPGSKIGTTMSGLAHYGRFGQLLFDYLYMRIITEKAGVPLETPDWVGHFVFNLNDPLPASHRDLLTLPAGQLINNIKSCGTEALCGYDFGYPTDAWQGLDWDPAYIKRAREIFQIRQFLLPYIDPTIQSIHQRGKTLVCIHIRRGDVKQLAQFQPTAWYLTWLNEIWPGLSEPVLYLASDDEKIIADFQAYNPLTLSATQTAVPGLEWLQDFYVLMHANILAISRSNFSVMAAILNKNNGVFYQPDEQRQCLSPYSVEDHRINTLA